MVAAAIVVGLILALKAGWIVYRAPPKIGTAMVWVLCCGGILGVIACLFLGLGHPRLGCKSRSAGVRHAGQRSILCRWWCRWVRRRRLFDDPPGNVNPRRAKPRRIPKTCGRASSVWRFGPPNWILRAMPRKQLKAGDLIDALGQKRERRRVGREPRPEPFKGQFSLAALVLLMTVASVGLAYFHYLGPTTIDEVARVRDRALHDAQDFPNNSAVEFVPLAAGVVSLILAGLLGSFVFYQPAKHGLTIVWVVTCLQLGLVLALSLPGRPLATIPLKDLKWIQFFPIAVLALSCTLPLGAMAAGMPATCRDAENSTSWPLVVAVLVALVVSCSRPSVPELATPQKPASSTNSRSNCRWPNRSPRSRRAEDPNSRCRVAANR